MICSKCGTRLKPEELTCRRCGTAARGHQPGAPAIAVAPPPPAVELEPQQPASAFESVAGQPPAEPAVAPAPSYAPQPEPVVEAVRAEDYPSQQYAPPAAQSEGAPLPQSMPSYAEAMPPAPVAFSPAPTATAVPPRQARARPQDNPAKLAIIALVLGGILAVFWYGFVESPRFLRSRDSGYAGQADGGW